MEPTPTQLRYIKRNARKAARDVLAAYAERSRIPVKPIAIARSMGLRVLEAPLPGYAWGMILGNLDGTAHIYFDENLPPVRARYACAHELGHYVANNCTLEPCMGYQCGSDEHQDMAEIYADTFAKELLLPHPEIDVCIEDGLSIFEIARTFEVPVGLITYSKKQKQ
jgi:Zn-dependent peptidase ImmA (M78 family)